MNTRLSDAEIADLTGYIRPSSQIGWLRRNGFVFMVAADGRPRVARAHFERIMGAAAGGTHQKTAPDFASLHRAGKRA